MTRGTALRFGAAPARHRQAGHARRAGGYVTFIGHDSEGAEVVEADLPPAAGQPHADDAPAAR